MRHCSIAGTGQGLFQSCGEIAWRLVHRRNPLFPGHIDQNRRALGRHAHWVGITVLAVGVVYVFLRDKIIQAISVAKF